MGVGGVHGCGLKMRFGFPGRRCKILTNVTCSLAGMNSKSGTILKRVLLALLAGFFLAFVLFVTAYATGGRTGEEFSPDDFSRRRFSYVRPDWLPITFSGIRYETTTGPVSRTLLVDGLLVPRQGSEKHWDLVEDNRMPTDSTAYDAKILCRYLDLVDIDGQHVFERWSMNHADHAAIFWPEVARLARAGRYQDVPRLMELVLNRPVPPLDEFAGMIADVMGLIDLSDQHE